MKSAPPPNSASFDSLWTSPDADDDDLPPALAPSLQGKVVPQEDRDTLIPPVPPGEYVQAMMQLGELDDPLDLSPAPPPRAAFPPPGVSKPLGLVLASEREILLDDPPARAQPFPAPSPGPRRRSTGGFAAVRDAREGPPPAVAQSFHGAVARAAARALPVPRAPSVPPPAPAEADPDIETSPTYEDLDTVEGLDSLDGLSPFSTGGTPPGPPVRLGEPRRNTPAALSVPTSSKPVPKSGRRGPVTMGETPKPPAQPASAPRPPVQDGGSLPRSPGAGLRLGKRAEAARSFTPAVISSAESQGPPSPRIDPPASEPAPNSIHDRALEMTALFDAQNYSSALVLAESVLVSDPGHPSARRCADTCREKLTEKYLGRLGGRHNIPRVTLSAEEIRWLALDHRAGFLLSFVDGSMSIDEVLDVSSMPELDALRIMFELRMQGVIEIVEPNRRPGRR